MQNVNSSLSTRQKMCGMVLLAVVAVASSHAAIDAEYTTILTDVTGFFASIKTLVISVVSFGIIVGFLKLANRH